MTTWHYPDSSQVVLKGDRVTTGGGRGIITNLWLEVVTGTPMARVEMERSGFNQSYRIDQLAYLSPEQELAETQAELVPTPENTRTLRFTELPEWRSEALGLAVRAMPCPQVNTGMGWLEVYAHTVTKLADRFLDYLDPEPNP